MRLDTFQWLGRQVVSMHDDRQAGIRLPKKCPLYSPGHNIHWIEYQKFVQGASREECSVRHVHGTTFEVTQASGSALWQHHDPERLVEALALTTFSGLRPLVADGRLLMPHGDGTYVFSMTTGPLQECPSMSKEGDR